MNAAWNITHCDTMAVRAVDGYRAVCSCGWKSVARRNRTLARKAGMRHVTITSTPDNAVAR